MNKIYASLPDFENVSQMDFLSFAIRYRIHFALSKGRLPYILCIGTDRMTGDCLGPLTGTMLLEKHCALPVHGTLHMPIHNNNLLPFLHTFYKNESNPYVIAIDTAFGNPKDIGKITFADEPIYPRTGMMDNKKAPFPVGDFSITGIIHKKEELSHFFNIRLYHVYQIAEYISNIIIKGTAPFC